MEGGCRRGIGEHAEVRLSTVPEVTCGFVRIGDVIELAQLVITEQAGRVGIRTGVRVFTQFNAEEAQERISGLDTCVPEISVELAADTAVTRDAYRCKACTTTRIVDRQVAVARDVSPELGGSCGCRCSKQCSGDQGSFELELHVACPVLAVPCTWYAATVPRRI